jgi:subtilisin-like proprotein convertase family protein
MRYLLTLFIILFAVSSADAQRYWNTSARVNGANYFAVNPINQIDNITSDFTIECWFMAESVISSTIIGKTGFRLLLDGSGGVLRARIQTNNNTKGYSSYAWNFQPWEWYHLAVTYDSSSSQFRFYINSDLDTTIIRTNADPSAGTDSLLIGSSAYASGNVHLDDIRIWNKTLSSNEIRGGYRKTFYYEHNQSNLVFSAPFDYSPTSGPYAGYHFYSQSPVYQRGTPEANQLGINPSMTVQTNTVLYLDGNGYARMRPNADIDFTGAFTVEFWVYPTSTEDRYIISKRNGATGWGIRYDSTSIILQIGNTSTFFSNNAAPVGKWTHIAITRPNGTGAKLYVNGKLRSNNSSILATSSNNDTLFIGRSPSISSCFAGFLDGIKISNYEKSASEIEKSPYEITDRTNDPEPPNNTVVFNFDYHALDNANRTVNGDNYNLMNGAMITGPQMLPYNVPIAPQIGGILNFPEGYTLKYSGNRIPQANTAGHMVPDSIFINSSTNISDINVFLSISHPNQTELDVTLHSPTGDSIMLWNNHYTVESKDHIITILDDQADSTVESQKYVEFGPRVRPVSSLNSIFGGKNPNGWWKIKVTDFANGNSGNLMGWGLQVNEDVLVGVEPPQNNEIPSKYSLEQNYPNPFNPVTKISYSLPKAGYTTIKIYDILGKETATIVKGSLSAGSYTVEFNGSAFSSGVYFYKLESGSYSEIKKMMLVK